MTKERIIELLECELECVCRQDTPDCNRDECGCSCCDLIQDTDEIISMYQEAIFYIRHYIEIRKVVGAWGCDLWSTNEDRHPEHPKEWYFDRILETFEKNYKEGAKANGKNSKV